MVEINPVGPLKYNLSEAKGKTHSPVLPGYIPEGEPTVPVGPNHVVGQDLVNRMLPTEIGPQSPILVQAAPLESKPTPATFSLAQTSGEVSDIWSASGGTHQYSPGQIIMNYGEQPLEYVSNPKVTEEAKAAGKTTATDCAVGDYDIMHDTYVRADNGEYLSKTPLKPGDPPVGVIKKAKGSVIVMPNGTKVNTLETIKAGKAPVEVTTGNVVMLDYKGNPYVGDVEKVFYKKNVPTSQEAEELFKDAKVFIDARKTALRELGESAKPVIEEAWKAFQKLHIPRI